MMQQGITAGTVLAVLLPVLIAIMCFASYRRSKDHFVASVNLKSPHAASRPAPRTAPRPVISPPILTKGPNYSPVSRTHDLIIWKSGPSEQKLLSEAPLGRADDSSTTESLEYSSMSSASESSSFTYSNPYSGLDPIGCRPMKIPRHFDGDYDTHEPVDSKPVIFHNILWDLDDSPSKESSV